MSAPAISVDHAGFRYRGSDAMAVSGITFDAPPGTRIAIMGASGAGKTTLARLLCGLAPHHYPGDLFGTVQIGDVATHQATLAELVRTSGMVSTDAESQLMARTVLDDAALGPANLGCTRDEVWRRARRALASVGLAEVANRETARLSGGEQQRLAIAGILAMQPGLLVLDEPTAQLDPEAAGEVDRIIETARDRTVVVVTHDPDRVLAWADLLVVLSQGEQAFFGGPEKFFADADAARHAGVRRPGIVEAIDATRRSGILGGKGYPRTVGEAAELCRTALPDFQKAAELPLPELARLSIGERQSEVSCAATGKIAPVIEARGLRHTYSSGVKALAGVDLTIEAGEFVALLGRNGAGKTTFARHLVNLLAPTAGDVLIDGVSTLKIPAHRLATRVGYVFQNPDHQIFAASVADEVAFGLRNLGIVGSEANDRVTEALERVGLITERDAHPLALSKGQRQRVALASVLALRPGAMVVDEPTTGQDWRGSLALGDLFSELHRDGHTIVMITHDMTLATGYATRAVVFERGQVGFDGPMTRLFADPDRTKRLHLAPPAITELGLRLGMGPVASVPDLMATWERHAR